MSGIHVEQAELRLPGAKKPIFRCTGIRFSTEKKYALLGPSGCGKSSFLDFLQGRSAIVTGKISDILTVENSTRIYQDLNLIRNFTILENAKLELTSTEEMVSFEKNLKALNLEKPLSTLVKKLSFGERQRVAVARACSKKTKWILADEPTAHLDPKHAVLAVEALVKSGKSLIVVTHDHGLKKYFDEVIDFTEWVTNE